MDLKRTIEKKKKKKCGERSKTGSGDAETWTYLTGSRPEQRSGIYCKIISYLPATFADVSSSTSAFLPPPRVTSLFLTDDAIIQLHATYKKMDFPSSTTRACSTTITTTTTTTLRSSRVVTATTGGVWPRYSVQLNA